MALSSVLNNHANVSINTDSGIINASGQPKNFLLSADKGSILNYAREGDALVIKFDSGKIIKIINFFLNGDDFNNLVFIDENGHWLTDFSKALISVGDGIVDPEVFYEELTDGDSADALLSILVASAAIGGIAAALSGGRGGGVNGEPLTRPPVPQFTVFDNVEPRVGIVAPNGYANDTTPTLNGVGGIPNGFVTIHISGHEAVTVQIGGDGTWTYTTPELIDGEYTITVTQSNNSGNYSDETSITITIDTVAPDVPVLINVYDNVEPHVGNIEYGAISNDKTPVFSGTGEPNSTIKIYDKDGKVVAKGVVDKDGKWSVELDTDLGEGAQSVTITSTDLAGNESAATPPFEFVVDTIPPVALDESAMDLLDDVGEVTGTIGRGDTTDDSRPEFKGIADSEDASFIEIFDNGKLVATVPVNEDGTWSWTPSEDLGDGSHTYTARAVDEAGNRGPMTSSWQFEINTSAPGADDVTIIGLTDYIEPVTGDIASGGITDDKTPTLHGAAKDNVARVNIYDGDVFLGVADVVDGQWSFVPPNELSDGDHNFVVYGVSHSNIEGAEAGSWSFAIDSTKPLAPVITSVYDDQPNVVGNVENGHTTDDKTPTVQGTGKASEIIEVFVNGQSAGTVIVGSDGNWELTIGNNAAENQITRENSSPLFEKDDNYVITAVAKNPNTGSISNVSNDYLIILDTTAPDAPVVDGVYDDVGLEQGQIVSGQSTDDTTPTFEGSGGEPGSTIHIKDSDGTIVGDGVVDADGNWTVTTRPLDEGQHDLTVTATDSAGNESAGTGFTVVVDTEAPTATASLVAISEDLGFDPSDFITSDNTLIYKIGVTGTLEEGDTVWMRIVDADGNSSEWLQATRQEDGSYIVDRNSAEFALDDGTYTIETVVRDAAGNASDAHDQNIVIDTNGQTLPAGSVNVTIESLYDNVAPQEGVFPNGTTTNDTSPLLQGTASGYEEGSYIQLYRILSNGEREYIGQSILSENGDWSYQLDGLTDGSYSYVAVVADMAGNEAKASDAFGFNVDTRAPTANDVAIIGLTDNVEPATGEISQGGITDDTTPTLHGTAQAGVSYVNVYDGNIFLGSAAVIDSQWSFVSPSSLDTGNHSFTVHGVDAAGNEGPVADHWDFIVDVTSPSVPAIIGIYDDVGTVVGRLEKGQTTDDTTPTVRGTGKAGEIVEVFVNGHSAGTVVIASNGNWELTIGNDSNGNPLLNADGKYVITATATNPDNGRISGKTGDYLIILDTTAPDTPDVPKGHDDQGMETGEITGGSTTDDRTPTLSGGDEEPGSTVTIIDNGHVIGQTVVDKDGNWSFTPDQELVDGEHSITTTVTDPAGNESDPSDSLDFTLDSSQVQITITHVRDDQEPQLGTITSGGFTNDRTPTFVGTSSPNATIVIRDQEGNDLGTAAADVAGNWTLTLDTPLAEGDYQLTATATNAAGNQASTGFEMHVDLTAPDAPVIDGVYDDVGPDQDQIVSGQPIDDTTPTFEGSGGEPGSTIHIKDNDGTIVGEGVVDAEGNWTVTTRPLGEGQHDLTVTATDSVGNESDGTDFTVIVDTQGPATAATLVAITEDLGIDPSDFLTSDNTLVYTITVNGSVANGDTVWMRIVNADGAASEWLQATRQQNGTYIVDRNHADFALADGTYIIETVVRDAAGNASVANEQEVIIDTRASAATVTIDGFVDNVGLEQHDYTTSGQKSDDATPELHGVLSGAEQGDRIHITAVGPDGSVIDFGYVIAAGSGAWRLQVPDDKAFSSEGHYTFTATVEDKGGNLGNSASFVIDYDITGPAAMDGDNIELWDDFGPVQGVIGQGDTTDDTTPTYRDESENAVDPEEVAYINVYNTNSNGNTSLIGRGEVHADGSWSFTPRPPLGAGDYNFTARPVDFAGNEGPATSPWSFTVVTERPQPPTLDFIHDNVSLDGSATATLIQKGGLTNDATPILSGTGGVSGATINIYMVGPNGERVLVDTTRVDANGRWRYELQEGLSAQGTYTFTATMVDAAGQESDPTGGYEIRLDTIAPEVSGQITAYDNVNVEGIIDGSAPTDDATPTFSGEQSRNEAGAIVYIYDRNSDTPNVPIATATVGADGQWSVESPRLPDGSHTIYYEVVDLAGNKSDPSDDLTFVIDTTGVEVSFSHYADSVGTPANINSGGLTNDANGIFVGEAKPGAQVVITYVNAAGETVTIGSVVADTVTGEWRITATDDLPDGRVNFTVTATDGTGQVATATGNITIDTQAPAAPTFEVIDDVGDFQSPPLPPLTSGQPTDDTTPTFQGSDGEPGSTITIRDEDGNVIGSTTVGSDGRWSVTVSALPSGAHEVSVTATDPAGNESAGTDFVVNIDLTVPTGTATLASISDDNGIAGDFITNDASLIYTLQASGVTQGDTVWLRITPIGADGRPGTPGAWVQATRQEDGTYVVNHNNAQSALADGSYRVETVVKDAAGNNGATGTQTVVIDTRASAATVTIDGFVDNVGPYTGLIVGDNPRTDDTTPEIQGRLNSAERGDRIHITAVGPDGSVIDFGYVIAGENGQWNMPVSDAQALSEGQYTFTATVEDKGGNIGNSAEYTLTVDTTIPQNVSSELVSISDDTGIVGDFNTSDQTIIYTIKVEGTLEESDTVWLRVTPKNGQPGEWIQATLNPDGSGTYIVDHNAEATEVILASGEYTVETIVRDQAGNATIPSSQVINIQTGGNTDAVITIGGFFDDQGAFTGFVSESGQVTDDATPKLSGNVQGLQSGDTIIIRVTDANGTRDLGLATIGADGTTWEYQVTADQALTEGDFSFTAVVINNVGVDGSMSNGFDLTVDLTGPDATAILESITDDTGSSSSDFITSDNTLIFTINATGVSVSEGDSVWLRIIPQGGVSGAWIQAHFDETIGKYVIDSNDPDSPNYLELADGTYTVETIVRDAVGNPSTTTPASQILVIDTSSPSEGNSLAFTGYVDNVDPITGILGNGTYTNDRSPLLQGTVTGLNAGEVIKIYLNGQELGNAIVDQNGNWSYQVGDDEANTGLDNGDGAYVFTASIVNQAGNVGTTTADFTINLDRLASEVNSIISGITDDTGRFSDDFITNDQTLIISAKVQGELAVNDYVQISVDGGETWHDAVYNAATDTWDYDNRNNVLSNGSHTFVTRVVDTAGNIGPASSQVIVIDNQRPTNNISIDYFSDNHGDVSNPNLQSGSYTDDTSPILHGSLSVPLTNNSVVAIYRGTRIVGYADVVGNRWSFADTGLQDAHFYTYTAAVQSGAGLNGARSNQFEIGIDITDAALAPNVGIGGEYPTYSMATRLGSNGGWVMTTDMAEYSSDGNNFRQYDEPNRLTWPAGIWSNIGGQYPAQKLFSSYTYGDFNRDGYMDIFLTDRTYDGATATVYSGQPDGSYQAHVFDVRTTIHFSSAISIDMDGDGWLDVFIGDSGSDSATFLHNKGLPGDGTVTGGQWDIYGYGTGIFAEGINNFRIDHELSGVDINNDGAVDLVVHGFVDINANLNNLVVLENDGTSSTNGSNWSIKQQLRNVFYYNGWIDDTYEHTIALTWADYNGDGYMDLFIGQTNTRNQSQPGARGDTSNDSVIFYNDGQGNLLEGQRFNDGVKGKSSVAIDWDGDGLMDIIEVPESTISIGQSIFWHNTGQVDGNNRVIWEKQNIKEMGIATSGGQTMTNVEVDRSVNSSSAAAIDYDWDGDIDLLISRDNTSLATVVVSNPNRPANGTSLHLRILNPDGSNTLFGNTVQLFDSKGNLVSSQIINPQYGTGWNDTSALVNYFGLNPDETYTAAVIRNVNGVSSDIGGLATLNDNTIENVNASWTDLKATQSYNGYVLTAESDTNRSNTGNYNGGGIVGTGYNDTFFATLGTHTYNGGGGWIVGNGERYWDVNTGMDVLDFKLADFQGRGIVIDLSFASAQNTNFGIVTLTNIEGIYGTQYNDTFTDGSGMNILNGRGGEDFFFLNNGGHNTLLYELIDTDDATGGNGHDTVSGITIFDYDDSESSDRFDISQLLIGYEADADGAAHYVNGVAVIDDGDTIADYLSVTYEGNNTILHIDRDGLGGTFDSQALITLLDTKVSLEELLANNQIVL
ncbi:Ig-like domain repeat protein [Bartonella tamiae]|uniref:Uncharacterized protein n=2 Tax=Bartonella tamiae TaxID=373638 RepID=J0ZLI8_9HYPH|nr:Ig-like domain repeat protein [Bartonella tamiae]EJF89278.1 hypothetical protein ME5_01829 [Bartonella tamiae Th239]